MFQKWLINECFYGIHQRNLNILLRKLKSFTVHGDKLFHVVVFLLSLIVIISMWNTLNGEVNVGGRSLDYGPNANSNAKKRWCLKETCHVYLFVTKPTHHTNNDAICTVLPCFHWPLSLPTVPHWYRESIYDENNNFA